MGSDTMLLDWMAKQNGEDRFESHRYPVVYFNILGTSYLKIIDPAVVRDLYTTHNGLTDKHSGTKQLVKPLLGDAFIFSKNDETWKARRKAISHVFFKSRLADMMENFKDMLGKEFS